MFEKKSFIVYICIVMNNKEIEKIINEYYSKKRDDNDYILHLDNKVEISVVNVNENIVQKAFDDKVSTGYNIHSNPYKIVNKNSIEMLSPDNIDIKFFWKILNEKFPLFSISQYPGCKNCDDVNKANINASKWMGFHTKLFNLIDKNPSSKTLEIGPGYGNFFNEITSNHNLVDYYAVDINKLFYYDGLLEGDGSSIPEGLGCDYDIVFSINTFNHMSKNQRSSYYKDVYKKLKKGGTFLFTNYLISEHNHHRNDFWSYQDELGHVYSSFFSQLIPIDDYHTLADELNDLGFSINVKLSQNLAIIECVK